MKTGFVSVIILTLVLVVGTFAELPADQKTRNTVTVNGWPDKPTEKSSIWIQKFHNAAGTAGKNIYEAMLGGLSDVADLLTVVLPTDKMDALPRVDRYLKVAMVPEGSHIRVNLTMADNAEIKGRQKSVKVDPEKSSKGIKKIVSVITADTGSKIKTRDIAITPPVVKKRTVKIALWLDRPNSLYKAGDPITVYYQATRDCYFSLFQFEPQREVTRLFPNKTENLNFLEGGRIYTRRYKVGGGSGLFTLKGVATIDPSNIMQPGVTIKSLTPRVGPLRIIPVTTPSMFADWELKRFFSLPTDRFDDAQVTFTVQ